MSVSKHAPQILIEPLPPVFDDIVDRHASFILPIFLLLWINDTVLKVRLQEVFHTSESDVVLPMGLGRVFDALTVDGPRHGDDEVVLTFRLRGRMLRFPRQIDEERGAFAKFTFIGDGRHHRL